jgi:hypothetical protein
MRFKSGAYADIHNEQGTRESIDNTGRAYYGDAMSAAPNHRMYKHIRKLNAIRKAVPALQKGSWRWAGNNGGNGVGFIRELPDSYAVVGLAKDGSVTHTFSGVRNGIYRDAVTGHEVNVTGGSLTFTVGPSSAGIYVLNGPGRIGDSGPGFFQTSADGSGGGGGGGGGSTMNPATIGTDPNPPVAGQNVTITYDGGLNSASRVVMHWGINGWTNVKDSDMTKNANGKWQVTIAVPTNATIINMAFNNGGSTWDSNNGQDYKRTVSASDGGGGTTKPSSVSTEPATVVAGQNVKIIYDGTLNNQPQVNMHWGINRWTEVRSSPMAKNATSGKWEVTVAVPSAATEINMAFNNGTGTWDNNNGADFKISVTSGNGGGGSGGGTGGSGIVSWTPAQPSTNDQITITITSSKGAKLHWGVNGWSAPAPVYHPAGTAPGDGATQTPFGSLIDGKRTLVLGPFNNSAQAVREINFVLKFDDNTWDNNNSQDWKITIQTATANEEETKPAFAQLVQNYPNPFNPSTVIGYELSEASRVKLEVLSVDGRHVATLVNSRVPIGRHGAVFNAAGLASGVYLYRIEAVTDNGHVFTQTRKMMLLK